MILLDEVDNEVLKQRHRQHPSTSTLSPPPPAFISDPAPPAYTTLEYVPHPERKRTQLDHRIWRATLYALGIYIALSVVLAAPLLVWKARQSSSHKHIPIAFSRYHVEDVKTANHVHLVRAATTVLACNPWRNSPSSATASMEYTLPRNGSIFFHSNVSEGDEWQQLVKGTLQVGINPDTKIHDTVFSFGLSYANEVSLKQVSVCLVDIGGSRGIRIVMPGDVTQVHPVIFDMKVLLPYHSGSPASFGEFRTYLPLVTQKLGDLDAFARFDRVYLEGPLSPVTVDSIQASKLTIKTSMAEISGSFNVSEFLDLDTTSAAVKANVLLANDRSSDFQRMTRMQISTGNSAIDANVTLLAHGGHTGDFPPDFDVSFATFNGDLSVSLGHHSLSRPSHLKAKMQNNLAPVNVTLDDLYQGTFDSQTKFATAHVLEGSTTLRTPFRVEAAVNGRATRAPRILYEYDHYVTSRIIGWTGWEKRARGRGQGHVEVVSSLSPVTLRLGHHNTT